MKKSALFPAWFNDEDRRWWSKRSGEVTSVRRMKSGAIALHSKHGRNFHTQFALAFWSARGAPPFWIPVTGLGIIGGIGFYKLGAPRCFSFRSCGQGFQTGGFLPGVLVF